MHRSQSSIYHVFWMSLIGLEDELLSNRRMRRIALWKSEKAGVP